MNRLFKISILVLSLTFLTIPRGYTAEPCDSGVSFWGMISPSLCEAIFTDEGYLPEVIEESSQQCRLLGESCRSYFQYQLDRGIQPHPPNYFSCEAGPDNLFYIHAKCIDI